MNKTKIGTVVSDKMNKTRVVVTEYKVRHPLYEKVMKKRIKYYAHDEENKSHTGDRVKIMESRPLSKLKRWRVLEILNSK